MPRVFFSYYLSDPGAADRFVHAMTEHVAPAARAEESVLAWNLHRTLDWPGSSDDEPNFVCVVDIADLQRWSDETSDSIMRTHGALRGFLKRIAMTVTEDADK